jgi:hypothetical protein
LQHLVQEFAGRPDERFALEVLILARRLADEDESASGLPLPKTSWVAWSRSSGVTPASRICCLMASS